METVAEVATAKVYFTILIEERQLELSFRGMLAKHGMIESEFLKDLVAVDEIGPINGDEIREVSGEILKGIHPIVGTGLVLAIGQSIDAVVP